jgi:hypothetical protein
MGVPRYVMLTNMEDCPAWPADRLARLSRQAGKALKKEWKL